MVAGGSERATAIARTVRALVDADVLPGVSDFESGERPVGRAWVRRVAGRNLWVWFRFSDAEVVLLTVTTEPPVPVGDGGGEPPPA